MKSANPSVWSFAARISALLALVLTLFICGNVAISLKQEGAAYPEGEQPMPPMLAGPEMVMVKMADGFDFPVGKPDAKNYYKSRGFRANGHLGDDWNGVGGGNTDLGDPVYSIGHGIVVFARDARMGWGNVVIVRHVFQSPSGGIRTVDSLYGHLDEVMVREKQTVRKGDQVGTIGTNRGMYWAHLHFEVRKNIKIGMRRSSFPRDLSAYYDPTDFIVRHRKLRVPRSKYKVAYNTFDDDRKFFPTRVATTAPTKTAPAESQEKARKKGGTFFQRSDDYFY